MLCAYITPATQSHSLFLRYHYLVGCIVSVEDILRVDVNSHGDISGRHSGYSLGV